MDVFQRTARRLSPLRVEHLRQQGVGRDVVLAKWISVGYNLSTSGGRRVEIVFVILRAVALVLLLVRVNIFHCMYMFMFIDYNNSFNLNCYSILLISLTEKQ